jgi:hypothetical protein
MSLSPPESSKFASLSGSLLARKGGARPAMRRPTAEIPHGAEDNGNDLGWNDMGYDVNPAVDAAPSRAPNLLSAAIPDYAPEVKRQQMEIAAKLSVPVEYVEEMPLTASTQRPISIAPPVPAISDAEATRLIRPVLREITLKAKKVGRGRARQKASAAFTLRLDHDRHLKLRLACAVHNESAQKLIIQAVDAMFDSMPEIEPLITRINAQ